MGWNRVRGGKVLSAQSVFVKRIITTLTPTPLPHDEGLKTRSMIKNCCSAIKVELANTLSVLSIEVKTQQMTIRSCGEGVGVDIVVGAKAPD